MALRRELYEELGIQLKSNYRYIYYRNPIYSLKNGEKVQCEERFFLVYSDGEQFVFNHWTESEQKRMRKGKWWSVDEIRQSNEAFFTRDIIEILNDLALGKIPLEPFEIA